MDIVHKVIAVKRIFRNFSAEENKFLRKVKISCLPGCRYCCTNPDLMAYPLEFFPYAWHLYEEVRAEEIYHSLEQTDCNLCILYNPVQPQGGCMEYTYRGLICRLFGFSRTTGRNNESRLFTCRIIKNNYIHLFDRIKNDPGMVDKAPLTTEYYSLLRAIDPMGCNELLPINSAIQKAIEAVGLYFLYRKTKS